MLALEQYKDIIDLSCPPRHAEIIGEEEKSTICDELLAFLLEERNRIAAGDTVYLYLTVPIASILYRCEVLEVDLPCPWEDRRGPDARALRMKLRETYAPGVLPIGLLQAHGIRSVRSARLAPAALVRAIAERTGCG